MKYNPKIDYVFCRDFFYGPKKKLDEMRKRKIYKGQLKPYFKEEKYMLKAKRTLQYIKRAGFNLSSIEKCYFLLTNKKLKLKKRKQEVLIDIIQNYQAFPTSYFAFEAFFMVITKKIFLKKWNVMMAEVIHNFIRLKERKMPVIFNYKKTKKVVDYLENHQEVIASIQEDNHIMGRLHRIKKEVKVLRHGKEKMKKKTGFDFDIAHALIDVPVEMYDRILAVLVKKFELHVIDYSFTSEAGKFSLEPAKNGISLEFIRRLDYGKEQQYGVFQIQDEEGEKEIILHLPQDFEEDKTYYLILTYNDVKARDTHFDINLK